MSKLLGITMGCPVGIGPEIIIRFQEQVPWQDTVYRPVVLGDLGVLAQSAKALGSKLSVVPWQPGEDIRPEAVNVLSLSTLGDDLGWGQPDATTGKAMAGYIEEAVRLIDDGTLAGMVTCPITKSALKMAGYHYPGHTEMLAELCGSKSYAMMMAGHRLRVTLVTIHVGFAQVADLLTPEKISGLISLTDQALKQDFGIKSPRLAVAGLNPHAGEGGMFGDEEQRLIIPALAKSRESGCQVEGPFPPDTIFNKAVEGQYDAVVCMYHDQGLIPFKLIHFEDGVNVTIGLPLVRTSVDHGTAYDIAGQGKANPASLAAAFDLAANIADNRRRFAEKQKMY
jgi:4-hydroxythreonine-4-phosphate dehydrogenase